MVRRKKKSFFTSPLKYSEHVNATVNESKREDIYQDFQVAFNKFLHKKKKKKNQAIIRQDARTPFYLLISSHSLLRIPSSTHQAQHYRKQQWGT